MQNAPDFLTFRTLLAAGEQTKIALGEYEFLGNIEPDVYITVTIYGFIKGKEFRRHCKMTALMAEEGIIDLEKFLLEKAEEAKKWFI